MSEQLYKNSNPNAGAEGTDANNTESNSSSGDANGEGNVYDADYKVEDDKK